MSTQGGRPRWRAGELRRRGAILVISLLVAAWAPASALPSGPTGGGAVHSTAIGAVGPTVVPGSSWHFDLVGHAPLYDRGMNSALAMYGHYAYVGNMSDGSALCSDGSSQCPHLHPGVLVVDVADPSDPQVVGEIGPPEEGVRGQSSRELRVWPSRRLLLVMNLRCDPFPYACRGGTQDSWSIDFFDIADPVHPRLVSTYVPPRKPHEMFLWVDRARPGRALLYLSTPGFGIGDAEMMAIDISRARSGRFRLLATGTWDRRFEKEAPRRFRACGGDPRTGANGSTFVHSVGVNDAGTRAYLAYWCGGFLVVDTSDLARSVEHPRLRLLTPVSARSTWTNPHSHSAVKIPGRPYVLTTDEVYGSDNTRYDPPGLHDGCPWGWVRVIDVHDAARPHIVSGYRIGQNTVSYCDGPAGSDPDEGEFTSYSSHNPTVLPDLALVAWHSGGLQAVGLADPAHPVAAGFFAPRPLDEVVVDHPAIGLGRNRDIVWSYPIVKHGLIYVVDVRNGLYVLRYTGRHAQEVARIAFLEGNSNVGDAARLSRPGRRAG